MAVDRGDVRHRLVNAFFARDRPAQRSLTGFTHLWEDSVLTPSAPRVRGARLCSAFLLSLFTILGLPRLVQAERVIVKGDNWEVFTDGRVGAFASWVYGYPVAGGDSPRDSQWGRVASYPPSRTPMILAERST